MVNEVVECGAPGRAPGSRRKSRQMVAGAISLAAVPAVVLGGAAPAHAIVPGSNGLIAFESNRNGNNNIFTMNPDGSVEKNLTRIPGHPANDVFPAWSPSGRKISFSSDRAEAGNLDIYTMNSDGSGVTRLTSSPGEDRGTSWTSSGGLIVFHSARDRDATHTFDIFTMNSDGTNQTKIFQNGSAAYVCGARSDGTIVFNSSSNPVGTNPDGDFEIFTMDIHGNNVKQVTFNAVLDSGPKWSPDCSTISYNTLDSGRSLDVHRINADGTGDVNLTNTPGVFDAFSAWSPDGKRVVFTSNRDGSYEIYTMDSADGSDVQQLTSTEPGQTNFRADWGTSPIRIATPPQTAQDCRNGGFKSYVTTVSFTKRFDNQLDCIKFVERQQP